MKIPSQNRQFANRNRSVDNYPKWENRDQNEIDELNESE